MGAGNRNRKIEIQRKSVTTDDYGGEVETWGTWCSAYADVRFSKGSERRAAAQETGSLAATFVVLDNTKTRAVTVTDRIVFDGANWDIVSVIPSRTLNKEREIEAIRAT